MSVSESTIPEQTEELSVDTYGFIETMRAALLAHDLSNRQTGRTTKMIERVTSADHILVASEKSAEVIRELLSNTGKLPKITVCDPRKTLTFWNTPEDENRKFYFDNDWVYLYLLHTLHGIEDNFKKLNPQILG